MLLNIEEIVLTESEFASLSSDELDDLALVQFTNNFYLIYDNSKIYDLWNNINNKLIKDDKPLLYNNKFVVFKSDLRLIKFYL